MASVFHCSPTNSTYFTTCCKVAVCGDDKKCPRCGEELSCPDDRSKWSAAFGPTKRRIMAERGLREGDCLMCGKPLDKCYC